MRIRFEHLMPPLTIFVSLSCGYPQSTGPLPSEKIVIKAGVPFRDPFKISVEAQTKTLDRDESFQVKGEVNPVGDGIGPSSITIKVEKKVKGRALEYGAFALLPSARNKSTNFQATLKAPNEPGVYDLYATGIYQTIDENKRTSVKRIRSDRTKLTVR